MNSKTAHPHLTPLTLWVITIATGLIVANLYYNQPLLSLVSKTFNVSEDKAGLISMLTQLGYAAGMLFLAPLADKMKRKRLMMIDFVFILISLIAAGIAPNINILIVASFFIGASSMIPQLLVPMAAHLATPDSRGKVVGQVMSGLLIGILLSRTLSGFIGQHFGWRAMFLIAAALMLVIWAFLFFLLPEVEPEYSGTYSALMLSMVALFKNEPKLRLAAFRGACVFGCFGAFWTTLTFLLQQPQFDTGSQTAGLFGLVGVAGALGASAMGRISDKTDPYYVTTATIAAVIVSYIVFMLSGSSLVGLVIGVILLDMGVQGTHISNQTMVLALHPEARNRINTVYMVSYFIGGSIGTYLASHFWSAYQWTGVCIIGLIFSGGALTAHLLCRKIAMAK
ncbi:putative MFS family arabinose efflux permease [Mucilaginibacter gracilis]|uniref:Putative MFS family arabinose efflux permease n=1 Tax=Mucilaginibacter gracilis TaxID=423350 RepID=A0A495J0Q9_9SPHI|nr:MFS transporter [Mucilaginibacter gracilis]RKR81948.1 putative MFS family arabinose efflux permease [Mucilaginibacter gracilis]